MSCKWRDGHEEYVRQDKAAEKECLARKDGMALW